MICANKKKVYWIHDVINQPILTSLSVFRQQGRRCVWLRRRKDIIYDSKKGNRTTLWSSHRLVIQYLFYHSFNDSSMWHSPTLIFGQLAQIHCFIQLKNKSTTFITSMHFSKIFSWVIYRIIGVREFCREYGSLNGRDCCMT